MCVSENIQSCGTHGWTSIHKSTNDESNSHSRESTLDGESTIKNNYKFKFKNIIALDNYAGESSQDYKSKSRWQD